MAYTNQDTVNAIISAAKSVAGDDWLGLAQAMLSVAWMESGFNPNAVGDGGTSFGIYQLHYGGQADAFVAQYGKDALHDPYKQAQFKASSMYASFQSLGGTAAMQSNPGSFISEFEWVTQRPAEKPTSERATAAFNTALSASQGDWSDIGEPDPINLDPSSPTSPATSDPFVQNPFSTMTMPWETSSFGGFGGGGNYLQQLLGSGYGHQSSGYLQNLLGGSGYDTDGGDYLQNLLGGV